MQAQDTNKGALEEKKQPVKKFLNQVRLSYHSYEIIYSRFQKILLIMSNLMKQSKFYLIITTLKFTKLFGE